MATLCKYNKIKNYSKKLSTTTNQIIRGHICTKVKIMKNLCHYLICKKVSNC